MRISGTREAGIGANVPRGADVRPVAPLPKQGGTVRLVARIASSTDLSERATALKDLHPSGPAPAQDPAATRAWLHATLDPLDRYIDGAPMQRRDPIAVPTLGTDGILA